MATNSLASLVVSLEANIAKFSTDMKSASDVTQRTMTGIQDSLGKAKSQFLGLAASVVSVGAAVQSVKGAINLGDDLKQVSDQTGVAIDKLDRLSIVAKLNGADLSTMTVGFKGLSKAIIESQDSTSKQAQLFKELGVAVKDGAGNLRGVDEVMGDVAKALSGIENETTRAAVGTALMGKGYLAMAATLRNYSADQEAATRVLENFGGVSVQAANLADELGDKFTLLGEGSKRALLGALVPGMAAVIAGLDAMIDGGGRFQTGFGQVVSWLAENGTKLFVVLGTEAKRAGLVIGAALAAIATGSLEPFRAFAEENQKLEAEFHATMARIKTAAQFPGLDDSDQVSRRAAAQDRLNKTTADAGKLAKILGDASKPDQIQDYANEIERLQAQMNKLAGTDGGYAHMIAAQQQIMKDLRDGKIITNEAIDAYIATARALDEQEKAAKELTETWDALEKAVKAANDAQQDIDDAIFKANQSIKDQNDALELEHQTLGLTDNARRQFITTLALEKAALEGNTNGVILLTKQLDLLRQQANDSALLEMAQQAQQAFEFATAFASDFFVDLFNNGTKAFKNLWESFKQLAFRALADVAAKQLIVSLTGVAGAGASGLAGASGGGGAGGIGGLLDLGKSLFSGGFGGGGGLLGAAGGFGGAQTVALDSALITAGFQNLAGGALTSVLGPVVAALPWAGLAAIAIPMITKLFDKGPANRTATFASGEASLIPDKSRDEVFQGSSAFGAFGIAKDFWLGAEEGGAFRPVIDTITALDNTIARLVGGDLTQQITEALATHSVTVGFGKEGTDINASGGPAEILKDRYVTVLTAIDAQLGALVESFEGTGEELANFVVNLVALKTQLSATFKDLDTASLLALGEAAGGLDKLAGSIAFLNENFISQADKVEKAQQQLTDAFTALELEVPATHQAFLDLLGTFDLTTEAGRGLYASVLALSGAFVQINGTATDAANSMKDAAVALEETVVATIHASDAYFAVFGGTKPGSDSSRTPKLTDAERAEQTLAQLSALAGQTTGDYGEELALQIKAVTGAITEASRRYPGVATLLRTANSQFGASLALFEDLSGRYSDEVAEQLVKLTESYNQQAKDLQGNAAALDVLNTVFEEQWTAIINGTAAGVDGTMSQLTRLQEGILGYVDSLKISADSPLTPLQKLDEARSQYESTLTKANAGDQTALGDVTRAADAYINLARDFYASSATYTELFNQITGELTALGTKDFDGTATPMNAADQALLDALPTGSKLMSALDFKDAAEYLRSAGASPATLAAQAVAATTSAATATQAASPAAEQAAEELAAALIEAVRLLAKSNTEDTNKLSGDLERAKTAIVEAITVGLK